jgi:two-component system, NarL family, sensor histidine kinase UhpB
MSMPLLLHLIGRLVAVVLICLAAAVAWVMIDARRSIDAEAAATADRVALRLEGVYWQKLLWRGGMLRETLVPMPDWQTLATASIVSPGVCVTFVPPGVSPQKLCSQIEALGAPPPALFAAASDVLFGPPPPVRRYLAVRDTDPVFVMAAAEPDAALRLAWRQVSVVTGVAAVMAAGLALIDPSRCHRPRKRVRNQPRPEERPPGASRRTATRLSLSRAGGSVPGAILRDGAGAPPQDEGPDFSPP